MDYPAGDCGGDDGRVFGTCDVEVEEYKDERVEEQCNCDAISWVGWEDEGGGDAQ